MNPIDTISLSPALAHRSLPLVSRNSGALKSAANLNEDPERVGAACKEMESLFLQQLLKEMRNTIPESGLSGTGSGKKMFTEMMDEALSKKMAEKGIGLADVLERQLMMKM